MDGTVEILNGRGRTDTKDAVSCRQSAFRWAQLDWLKEEWWRDLRDELNTLSPPLNPHMSHGTEDAGFKFCIQQTALYRLTHACSHALAQSSVCAFPPYVPTHCNTHISWLKASRWPCNKWKLTTRSGGNQLCKGGSSESFTNRRLFRKNVWMPYMSWITTLIWMCEGRTCVLSKQWF